MGLPSTAFHRRGYVIEVLAAPLVFRHSMTKESECPRHRFSGLACGTAGQLNGCLSPSEDVGKCFCVGRRTYIPKNKKACPCLVGSANFPRLRKLPLHGYIMMGGSVGIWEMGSPGGRK